MQSCNKSLSGFRAQSINNPQDFVPDNVKFTYLGPTSQKTVQVESKPKTKTKISNVTAEISNPICVLNNKLEADVQFRFDLLESGPYKITGGDYEGTIGGLLDSFVVFQNLNIQTKIKYVFDPATFCQNNNLDITNSFDLQVEKVDFSKYYSYEGNNPDNVDVDEDLSKLFQVSNSPFAVQFKSYVFPLIKTDLGKLIVQEFQRLYCVTDNSSSREEKFVTAFERYTRKMDILQRLGLIYMLNKN
jgi:hypothetical protein